MKRLATLSAICLALLFTVTTHADDKGFTPLFNGKNLDGWVQHGGKAKYDIVENTIVGTSVPKTPNSFLCTQKMYDDFELQVDFKVDPLLNSGIQIRSNVYDTDKTLETKDANGKDKKIKIAAGRVHGYQVEIDPSDRAWSGGIYDEGRRGWLNNLADNKAAQKAFKQNEWNHYRIVCRGNSIKTWINGVPAADLKDDLTSKGFIALQVHGVGNHPEKVGKQVSWRNVKIKELNPKKKVKKKKPAPKKEVGAAIGGNKATPIDRISAAKGFKVELLYSVPGQDQGSWVNLCTDDKGRLLVSDQYGGLYRITLPPAGEEVKAEDVEKIPAGIRGVNGMLWSDGALYVGVNDYERKIASGLYRISDSNGDDQLDQVELLQEVESHSDHGVHALMPTPDGEDFYLVTGNNTIPPTLADSSPVRQVWGEDHLLPSMPDGRGHNRGVLAPGGIIYRVSPDGQKFEAYASGFRNIFDAAVNRDGELFTYDADMEYDFNTPWYRPTRICHVTSGAEFGWRNGAGKRPPFYADNLPGVLDIGPGSPTGMTFGYGAKFPAKYQNALYALDWSWGKLYAIHLKPEGSSYTATKEEFVTGAPLPITDAIIHPQDGAMYFTIGGRRVQSGLYRVTYVGDESTEPVQAKPTENKARKTRQTLEAFHGKQDPEAIEVAWPYLADQDRFIRFAARTAVEHQPTDTWSEKALTESDPARQVEALLALARVTGVCPQHRNEQTPEVDTAMRDKLLSAIINIDDSHLDLSQQLTLQRALQIILNRFGQPDDATVAKLIEKFDAQFPAKSPELNWLLCETLAWLQSPTLAEKAIALIQSAPTQEEQMQYARSIRMLQAGWTPELHKAYFEWFLKAANYKGGASFDKFIEFVRNDAVASLSEEQKTELAEILAKKPVKKSALENLGEVFAGRPTNKWTLEELSAAASKEMKKRDFVNGQKMFAATGCYACHRFGNQGGMTGPDLTSAGRRYSPHDLLDQVINPSKVINEQFSAISVVTEDGKVHTGVVVNLSGDNMTLNTDLTDPNKRVNIDRKTIDELVVSKTSPMPADLFARMTKDEILDLIAYLISAGDAQHPFFQD